MIIQKITVAAGLIQQILGVLAPQSCNSLESKLQHLT